jgi:hypothetical protein
VCARRGDREGKGRGGRRGLDSLGRAGKGDVVPSSERAFSIFISFFGSNSKEKKSDTRASQLKL